MCGSTVTLHDLASDAALTIGRDEDCDIRIDAVGVSRRHAVLHVGPPLEIEDLGSSNGTFVALTGAQEAGGRTDPVALKRLSGKRIGLSVGDSINVGSASAVVRRSVAAPVAPSGKAAPPAGPGDAIVVEPAMRALYEEAGRAARSDLPVMILGETGAGKDVLAEFIHRASRRAARSLLALNCAALSESLLESELFGYEKGAFTGAQQTRPGLLESAEGGTVFLDEIGDLPAALQAKLLRVIERREVLRLGGRTPRSLDVRFVSATNKDLDAALEAGAFRQDLFFRLNALTLTIPPLRERRAEIAPLAARFLADARSRADSSDPVVLAPDALSLLERHAWPGNVRELRHVIERAAVLSSGGVITPAHLPRKLVETVAAAGPADDLERLRGEVTAAEKKRILDALARCDGNQTRAAELLGIARRTLINRIEEHGIERPRKR
jgi:transcriptional regulator with PAS, ATPase and Fis domain